MNPQLKKEYQIFLSHQDEFKKEHLNEYVLIKDEQVIDFYPTYKDALRAGLVKFGDVPFFVKVVTQEEEVHTFYQGI